MASRRIALIGTNEGPWVDISRIKNPVLRVVKLPPHASVVILLRDEEGRDALMSFLMNGDHPVPDSSWARVSVQDCARHMTVCEILSKKVA